MSLENATYLEAGPRMEEGIQTCNQQIHKYHPIVVRETQPVVFVF